MITFILGLTTGLIAGTLIGLALAGMAQARAEQQGWNNGRLDLRPRPIPPPPPPAQLDTVRSTLSTVARERDHAHALLRAINQAGAVPPELQVSVNCAVARD